MYEKIPIAGMEKEDWLRLRKSGIGGSDAGAICGMNPYVSPMNIFMDKTGNGASEPSQTTNASEGKTDASVRCELIPGVAYIVTNHVRLHGASALIDSDFLQEFAGGRNLYILPSSIHDLIIVQETADMNPAMLDEMVQQVNSESVGKEEQLADHAYFYDVSDAELRIRA